MRLSFKGYICQDCPLCIFFHTYSHQAFFCRQLPSQSLNHFFNSSPFAALYSRLAYDYQLAFNVQQTFFLIWNDTLSPLFILPCSIAMTYIMERWT